MADATDRPYDAPRSDDPLTPGGVPPAPEVSRRDKALFWGCFASLVATAFAFIIRALIIEKGVWIDDYGLSQTQLGEIGGVGLWPFAISIVLFSLFIDRIGYGTAMIFAFAAHALSTVMLMFTDTIGPLLGPTELTPEQVEAGTRSGYYYALYLSTFLCALANGTVEAVINPVVATMFRREKTKWLNILHAGWPAGLVLGGILALAVGAMGSIQWEYQVAIGLIPILLYGILLFGRSFPVSERVEAGVSDQAVLREVGVIGALIVSALICREVLGNQFGMPWWVQLAAILILTGAYGFFAKSVGRPLFIFLLLVMMPLAITELGTDGWIGSLMAPEMAKIGLAGTWVLVYTSLIMMVLRFNAGPIVHRISPLGLLAVSAAIAAVGLFALSYSAGIVILLAATLYGVGKTFFWPTMLGVVAEQFPRGGALTLNTIAGVGMLSAGVLGAPLLGNLQDTRTVAKVRTADSIEEAGLVQSKTGIFGRYDAINADAIKTLPEAEQTRIGEYQAESKKEALRVIALLPVLMLLCYIGLIVYFRSRGGYKAEVLVGDAADDERFTGGVEGPADR